MDTIAGKCSAAALDALSNVYKEDILGPLLPILMETLSSAEWEVKELGKCFSISSLVSAEIVALQVVEI